MNEKNGKKKLYTILEGVIIAVIGGVIVYMITTGTIGLNGLGVLLF